MKWDVWIVLLSVANKNYPLRLVQITDCHLESQVGGTLLGLNTDESLQDVIDLVRAQNPRIDCLLVTGDLAGEGAEAAYKRFRSHYLPQLSHPIACLPGNHDNLQTMTNELGNLLTKTIEMGDWLLILLDSRIPGSEFGNISDSEMQLLAQLLEQNPDKHIIIFLHHQVLPVGSRWIDQHAIRSAPQFVQLVKSHSQVKLVVSGHVHQATVKQEGDTTWITTPSTCVQFKPNSDDFAVDEAMPGYRWFDLYPDGRVVSDIKRVEGKSYPVDLLSSGY